MRRPGRRNVARVGACLAAGLALVAAFAVLGLAGLRYSPSYSLPVGFYVQSLRDAGCAVSFCPPEPFARLAKERGYRESGSCPDGAAALMKPVVAHGGDVVTVSARGLAVNGRLLPNTLPLASDSKGRGLSAWPAGTYPVDSAALWVVSIYTPRSFDSRYFGPIAADSVRERLRPLLVWR
jgi:conjugative transfer signal peptidase TraF